MSAEELERLRRELDEIGRRRLVHESNNAQLAKDTAAVVRRAEGKLEMLEVAKRVGLDRTTLYRVYRRNG